MKETKEEYFARMDKAVRIFNEITNLRLKIKSLESEVEHLCWEPENGKENVSSETLRKWGKEYHEEKGNMEKTS
jgi:hypothetical protein